MTLRPWQRSIAVVIAPILAGPAVMLGAEVLASPPACDRTDAALFAHADAVVEAAVTSSRRWKSGPTTIHLVAKYRVSRVFKGAVAPGDTVIVTDTCLDMPIPQSQLGYPGVMNYCLGGRNLSLTGVRTGDGRPAATAASGKGWILFLDADRRPGAPELTWLEVSRTGFGGGCRVSADDLPIGQRDGFRRMRARRGS